MAAPVYILTSPYRRTFGSQSVHNRLTIRALSGHYRGEVGCDRLILCYIGSHSSHIRLTSAYNLVIFFAHPAHCLAAFVSLSAHLSKNSHIRLISAYNLVIVFSHPAHCLAAVVSLSAHLSKHAFTHDWSRFYSRFSHIFVGSLSGAQSAPV